MRITTSVVLAYVWLYASASLLVSIGFAEAIGVPMDETAGESFQQAIDEAGNVDAGNLAVESLIGIYTVVTGSVEAIVTALTTAPRFLIGLGIPTEFVLFIHAPLGLLTGRYLIYMLSERSM